MILEGVIPIIKVLHNHNIGTRVVAITHILIKIWNTELGKENSFLVSQKIMRKLTTFALKKNTVSFEWLSKGKIT